MKSIIFFMLKFLSRENEEYIFAKTVPIKLEFFLVFALFNISSPIEEPKNNKQSSHRLKEN
jgi:hypothetical protein